MGIRARVLSALALAAGFSACAQGNMISGPSSASSSGGPGGSSGSTGHAASSASAGSSSTGGGGTSSSGNMGSTGGFSGASASSTGSTGSTGSGGLGGTGGAVPTGPGCLSPILVTVPSMHTGDTTGKPNDGDGSCQLGGAGDVVYQVNVAMDGVLDLNLDTTAHLGVHARSTCDDPFAELGCADSGAAGPQTLSLSVLQGDLVYVFVDGHGASDHGPFSITFKLHGPVCGDGIIDGTETCDPPDGITCGANCMPQPEICNDGIDNDGNGLTDCEDPACAASPLCPNAMICAALPLAHPSNIGDTTAGTKAFAGSCSGALAREAVYAFAAPAAGILSLTLQSVADLGLYVRGTCADNATELGCADLVGGGMPETLSVLVKGGSPVAIFVDGSFSTEVGPFTLGTAFQPLTEIEPNDAPATANAFVAPFYAAISPAGDRDYVTISVPGPSSKLTAQVDDVGNGDCANFNLDSEVEIYGTNGTTSLAFNDDNATDFCSLATATGLVAGKYYVRVAASQVKAPGTTFMYRLKLTVQ